MRCGHRPHSPYACNGIALFLESPSVEYPVVIVGGGLAGLLSARLLQRAGIDFLLLEARDRLGGRILTVDATGQPAVDGFDLGPSWFWPAMQPGMEALVQELGLASFPQFDAGDFLFQRSRAEPPVRYPGMTQEPRSMRLAGGTGALIEALAAQLPTSSLQLGQRVTRVERRGSGLDVGCVDPQGYERQVQAAQLVLALPPRLLAASVSFAPALDAETSRRWRATPTWMAPHAKFFAVYETPFWRAAGLSGGAQSLVGPMGEIHDATSASGRAALFGFVGVAAAQRARVGRDALMGAAVRQLEQLFGAPAGQPSATLLQDWATDPLTATADDQIAGGHPEPAAEPWITGAWQDCIVLAGSETSAVAPGYLAGAVHAAQSAVEDVQQRLATVAAMGAACAPRKGDP